MADKELERVRSKFVNKVSKAVIKQLLDDLLGDKVINDGEKESVLEENDSREDRARGLIDTVRKKGHSASRKMIDHLQSRDETLYSELGLSGGQPAQPEPPQEKGQLTTPGPFDSGAGKKDKESSYSVTKDSIRSRVALLITNIEFAHLKNRSGAEKDQENMEKLLSSLGYEVVKYTNLRGKAINKAVIDFSTHQKLKDTDSAVVVVMSHGKLGTVCGVDWKKVASGNEEPDEFPINNIFKHLGSERCPALLNKPKVIIIQACRGEESGSVLVSDEAQAAFVCDGVNEMKMEDDALQFVHKEKDFICLLSCTPDTVSYRHQDQGSLLIQYLVEVFNTCAHQDDIEELFRKVMRRFEDFSSESRRQMPTKDRCTLTRRFFFSPSL